jgi:hypothetical protein
VPVLRMAVPYRKQQADANASDFTQRELRRIKIPAFGGKMRRGGPHSLAVGVYSEKRGPTRAV